MEFLEIKGYCFPFFNITQLNEKYKFNVWNNCFFNIDNGNKWKFLRENNFFLKKVTKWWLLIKEILFFYHISNHFRFLSPRPSRFSNQIVLKYILIEGPHNGCCTRPPKVCLARTCCATWKVPGTMDPYPHPATTTTADSSLQGK